MSVIEARSILDESGPDRGASAGTDGEGSELPDHSRDYAATGSGLAMTPPGIG